MKATGIVRRIDDLGRVVIPKEIRRTMRIREGAPHIQHWQYSTGFVWQYIVWQKEKRSGNHSVFCFFSCLRKPDL